MIFVITHHLKGGRVGALIISDCLQVQSFLFGNALSVMSSD